MPIYRTRYNNSFSENISLWEGVPIYRTSYNNSFGRRIFHFGRVCQYTEQDTITAFQRIFHFGRVCQYTEQATITGGEYFTLGGCASENISLWEGVPIYRTSYNNSFGRRIFHFGRVCQYTEQDTITALGGEYFTLGGCANIQKGLLQLCECALDGGSILRWWGHLTTICTNRTFSCHRWWGP